MAPSEGLQGEDSSSNTTERNPLRKESVSDLIEEVLLQTETVSPKDGRSPQDAPRSAVPEDQPPKSFSLVSAGYTTAATPKKLLSLTRLDTSMGGSRSSYSQSDSSSTGFSPLNGTPRFSSASILSAQSSPTTIASYLGAREITPIKGISNVSTSPGGKQFADYVISSRSPDGIPEDWLLQQIARSSAPFFDPYQSTVLPCVPEPAAQASTPPRQSIASPNHRRSRNPSKEGSIRSSRNHSRTSTAKIESFGPLPPKLKTSEPTGDARPTLPTPPLPPNINNEELWERGLKKVAENKWQDHEDESRGRRSSSSF